MLLRFLYLQDDAEERKTLGSENTVFETMRKVEAAAKDVSLAVERTNNFKVYNGIHTLKFCRITPILVLQVFMYLFR